VEVRGFAGLKWRETRKEMPPLHTQVLVALRAGFNYVCDVACYIGSQDNGSGKQVDRWILADVFLETRQITYWAPIQSPSELLARYKQKPS
jgi:hypothetical protein